MPTITLNRKILESQIGKLPDEKIKDRISMLGTDLESINENEIVVEIFPNRPDMLSEQGFARALSAFIGKKTGLKKYKIKASKEKVIVEKSVNKVRPFTACAIVKDINFNNEKIKEVIDIQEKLHITFGRNRKKVAIGIYPLEKIEFPVRFVAEDPDKIKFIPLDFEEELTGRQILNRHPAGRDYGYLLEGLKKFPFFIDSNKQILSMPPIINSEITGKITENTKDVFIECSGFDFNALQICLNIIVTALADMGGEINSLQLQYPNKRYVTPNLTPKKIKFDFEYANKLLGLNLNQTQIKKLLAKMGCDLQGNCVLVPAYRADVLHSIDIVEDIAIAYGYENFDAEIPNIATIAEEDKFEKFKRKIAEILIGLGLFESNTYHLISKDVQTKNMDLKIDTIEIENPISEEYNTLRAWLIPSLMQVLKANKHNEYPQKIFEIATVFKNLEEEINRIAVLIASTDTDYTEIRQILDSLLSSLNLEYEIKEVEHNSFIPGRVGRVSVNGKEVAYIGEINPKVLRNFALEIPVTAFELNLSEIFSLID